MAIDWSKITIHCSSLYGIMVGNAKTNMELYLEACDEIVKKQASLDKLKKKDGKMGFKYIDDIKKLEAIIPILESQKDVEEPLSKGCKTHLSGVYAYAKYHKWNPSKDIGSDATEKGKEVEPDALALVSVLDGILLLKNEERVEDDHFSGLPDAFEGESLLNATTIHDVKCPKDIESFFSYINKELPAQYYWQMQGYMALTGAKQAKVHFCLMNTPEHQIRRMAGSLLNRMNVISELSPEYVQAEKELYNNLTFDDIPLNERRFVFTVDRNDDDIEKARKKVEKCREYLVEFEKTHLGIENIVESVINT